MKAADTNVVVRFIVEDDRAQSELVARLIETDGIVITNTVLLETEWVLRSIYRFSKQDVSKAMMTLMRTYGIDFAQPESVLAATEWHARGMDFADALHLAQTTSGQHFASFDVELSTLATSFENTPPVTLL
jgi:predicted nucleic-acid-binding protein